MANILNRKKKKITESSLYGIFNRLLIFFASETMSTLPISSSNVCAILKLKQK